MGQTQTPVQQKTATTALSWFAFLAFTVLGLWAAHAVAFFMHEYSHSFTAWLLGWKANPLALHYPHPSARVFLLQLGISENVDYAPIFASGHGWQAAFIAAAGMLVGNALITYPLSFWGMARARLRNERVRATFFYWLCVASVGNFIDYVPVRTFADEDDMHTVVRGLGCSPWWILVVLGVPFSIALAHLLFRVEPQLLQWLLPGSPVKRGISVLLTSFMLFGFYGASGWAENDLISHWSSAVSLNVMVPLTTIVGWWLVRRKASTE